MREQLNNIPILRCESDVLIFNATEFPYPFQPSATVCCFMKLIIIPRCSFVIFICWILNVNMLSVIEQQGNKKEFVNHVPVKTRSPFCDIEELLMRTFYHQLFTLEWTFFVIHHLDFLLQVFPDNSHASWHKIIIWMGKNYFLINIETQKTQKLFGTLKYSSKKFPFMRFHSPDFIINVCTILFSARLLSLNSFFAKVNNFNLSPTQTSLSWCRAFLVSKNKIFIK